MRFRGQALEAALFSQIPHPSLIHVSFPYREFSALAATLHNLPNRQMDANGVFFWPLLSITRL